MVEAFQRAEAEVRANPQSGSAWGNLGMTLMANGYETQGTECLAVAEKLEPANVLWPYLQGVEAAPSNPRKAIPYFQRALEKATNADERATIHFRLANLYLQLVELGETQTHLDKLREFEPNSSRCHYVAGLLASARRNRPQMVEHLRSLVESPFAGRQATSLLASLGDVDKELAELCRDKMAHLAVGSDDAWPDALEGVMRQKKVNRMERIERYKELLHQGRRDEALQFLSEFVAASPDAEVTSLLGVELYTSKRYLEAERILRRAIQYDPKNALNHFLLGSTLLQMAASLDRQPEGKAKARELFRDAVAEENEAIALHPAHGYAFQTRGLARKYLGQSKEALQDLRQALLLAPESVDMHLSLGEALAESGDLEEGLKHLEDADELAAGTDSRPKLALEKWRPRK
jgi:tetratricopeptide (TPR) repeat protein